MESKKPDVVNEPDIEYGCYSYADCLTWEIDRMVELIKGTSRGIYWKYRKLSQKYRLSRFA
jgi:hypothetical protein